MQWGSVDYQQLKQLRDGLGKLSGAEMDRFCAEVSRELAARLLALVIPRTPVGQYPKGGGKTGGTLRRGWTARTKEEVQQGKSKGARAYASALPVEKAGEVYTIEVIDPVEYASYVEFGHRKTGGKGWVPGQYFLTASEEDLRRLAPALIRKKLERQLKGVFDGG